MNPSGRSTKTRLAVFALAAVLSLSCGNNGTSPANPDAGPTTQQAAASQPTPTPSASAAAVPDPLAARRARALQWVELGRRAVTREPRLAVDNFVALARVAEPIDPATSASLVDAADHALKDGDGAGCDALTKWFLDHGDVKKARSYLDRFTNEGAPTVHIPDRRRLAVRRALDGKLDDALREYTDGLDFSRIGVDTAIGTRDMNADVAVDLAHFAAEEPVRRMLPGLDAERQPEVLLALFEAFAADGRTADLERVAPEVEKVLKPADASRLRLVRAYVRAGKEPAARATADAFTAKVMTLPSIEGITLIAWPDDLDASYADGLPKRIYDDALKRGLRDGDYNIARVLAPFDRKLGREILDRLGPCKMDRTVMNAEEYCKTMRPHEIARSKARLGDPWELIEQGASAEAGIVMARLTFRDTNYELTAEDGARLEKLLAAGP